MIITLTTDFGTGSPYVAQLKGVILTINRTATLVDLTHEIPPQDIRQGALVLEDVTPRFPQGTIHVAVVDPGVGTARKLVYAQLGGQQYLAPDNGILSRVASAATAARVVALTNRSYWLPQVSPTFHGRDILAPVAAHLSLGLPPERLGEPLDQLEPLDWPGAVREPGRITGAVLAIDSFGNLITNIDAASVASVVGPASLTVAGSGATTTGFVRTYGERPAGALVALVGSSDRLELAIVGGNAAQALHAKIGAPVVLTW
jgi:S-adenosyl-L-methionine hydrolase (adenosine-forming)